MPKKILPNAEAFALFDEWMLSLAFTSIPHMEFKKDFARLGLEAPRPREGREVGYKFSSCNLEVIVWTTYLCPAGPMRDEDAGWVLIREGDRARYFSHPMPRTKNFLSHLYKRAFVAQKRIMLRPLCSECKKYMSIQFGKGLKSRYWECRQVGKHADGKRVRLSWDQGLEAYPNVLAFVKAERDVRERYRDAARVEGKKPGTAMLNRKPWRPKRPENML